MIKTKQKNSPHKLDKNDIKKIAKDPFTYCFAFIALIILAYAILDIVGISNIKYKLIINILIFIALYVCGVLKIKKQNCSTETVMKRIYLVMFLCYVYFLLSVTLFDASLGRGENLEHIQMWAQKREYYNKWFINFIPFKTVKNIYIDGLVHGYVSKGYVILNFLGNLLILSPLAVFLPALNRHFSKIYISVPLFLAVTLLIEALQYTFMCGSCDIDDVILNFVGATIVFLILKIPPVSRLQNKIMYPSFKTK